MSKKINPEAAATAKFRTAKKSVDIVAQTNTAAEIIKANAQYATEPLVQAAVATWQASAVDLAQNDQAREAAKATVRGLVAKRQVAVATWRRATKAMLNVIDTVSAGSAKDIKDWGFDITTRVVGPPDNSPPEVPKITYNKHMEPTIRWKAVPGHKGYNLQLGDGSPTGWGAVIQVAQARYKLTGTTPGQHIEARVAVQRKDGVSPYSSPMNEIIR